MEVVLVASSHAPVETPEEGFGAQTRSKTQSVLCWAMDRQSCSQKGQAHGEAIAVAFGRKCRREVDGTSLEGESGTLRILEALINRVRRPPFRGYNCHPSCQITRPGSVWCWMQNCVSRIRAVPVGSSWRAFKNDGQAHEGSFRERSQHAIVVELASSFSQAGVLPVIVSAVEKPDNGARGRVVGDFFRRLVARTLAQQFAENAKEATTALWKPERVAHVLQGLTNLDDNATVVSLDGMGPYVSTPRNSLLSGLTDMRDGAVVAIRKNVPPGPFHSSLGG